MREAVRGMWVGRGEVRSKRARGAWGAGRGGEGGGGGGVVVKQQGSLLACAGTFMECLASGGLRARGRTHPASAL